MNVKKGLAVMAVVLTPLTAFSQGDLGTINVTTQGASASITSSSKSMTVIDRATIESSHAQFVTDLLRGHSGLVVRDTTGTGSKAKVDLGGFGETSQSNLVVLIDGRRVNSPDMSGVDWTQISASQIERIEITHGASPVLYGDGAVGGVINIITRVPESGGKISLGSGSFGSSNGALRLGSASGRSRMEINVSGDKTDGYRDNSKYERIDAGARAEVDLTENVSLRISGNHHTDRAGLPGALTIAESAVNSKQTKKPTDWGKITDSFIDIGASVAFDSGVELDVAGSFRKRDTSAEFSGWPVNSTLRTRTLRPKVSYRHEGEGFSTALIAGAELEWSSGQVSGFDYERNRQGSYVQGDLGLIGGRFHLIGGYRHEAMDDAFGTGGVTTIANNLDAWEVGSSFELSEGLQVRAQYARSLRLPALDERYMAAIPAWFIPASLNTNLLPQTGNHLSAAISYAADDLRAELEFSRADISNEIFYNPATFANENYTIKTRHDVVRASVAVDLNTMAKLEANYSLVKATFRGGGYNGNRVPSVADNILGASWRAEWLMGLSSLLKVSYVGSSYFVSDQANANPKLPAYAIWDVMMNYRYGELDLFAGIDNLTNKNYATYGAYTSVYPAAGMQLRAGASYSF